MLLDKDILQLFSLRDRVAIVTGASRGIGAFIAEGFVKSGATVIGIGRSDSSLVTENDSFEYSQCDVTDTQAFNKLCERVFEDKGKLDVLVNAAGITIPVENSEDELSAFEETLKVNLLAVHSCCLAALNYIVKSGGGSIINVTSISSVLGFPGNPGYAASKGGLRMLTKALAIDYGDVNVRINNLAPGYIRTSMTQESFDDPRENELRRNHTILGRWGEPEDIVGAAIFLASDASAYITGTDLFVDGGWTAKGMK
ncbi:SDR family oxidoreductase [Candidatus Marinimicrobia bacterium MT.SAG.4]|nr:SDR family oxidoreductase [Candidatus Marinimicrobia bacterium MT.SAG.4]